MEAAAGAVWLKNAEGGFDKVSQVNRSATAPEQSAGTAADHVRLLQRVARQGQVLWLPPGAELEQSGGETAANRSARNSSSPRC